MDVPDQTPDNVFFVQELSSNMLVNAGPLMTLYLIYGLIYGIAVLALAKSNNLIVRLIQSNIRRNLFCFLFLATFQE